MQAQIRRIVSEVAGKSAKWSKDHKKVLGGVGAAGAAGTLGGESVMELTGKGLGLGRKLMKVDDAIDRASGEQHRQG